MSSQTPTRRPCPARHHHHHVIIAVVVVVIINYMQLVGFWTLLGAYRSSKLPPNESGQSHSGCQHLQSCSQAAALKQVAQAVVETLRWWRDMHVHSAVTTKQTGRLRTKLASVCHHAVMSNCKWHNWQEQLRHTCYRMRTRFFCLVFCAASAHEPSCCIIRHGAIACCLTF